MKCKNCNASPQNDIRNAVLVKGDTYVADITKIILQELSPAQLLRDKEMLDWLDKNRVHYIYDCFKSHASTAASQETWREAILDAMKQTEEKGK